MSAASEEKVRKLIEREGLPAGAVEKIGEGAYGEVWSVAAKEKYVVKLFKKQGVAKKEADALRELKMLRAAPVPEVIRLVEDAAGDAIVMSYLEGVPMSRGGFSRAAREKAASEIAEALKKLIVGKGLYGALGAVSDVSFRDFYFKKAEKILNRAKSYAARGGLTAVTVEVMEDAFSRFDEIFDSEPLNRAFVHGDLNPENIMLLSDGTLAGFYDPIESFCGDSEYELFQLETNGGKRFPVLKKYFALVPQSPRYPLKRDFYRLFAEVGFYADAGIKEDKTIVGYRSSLKKSLKKYCK